MPATSQVPFINECHSEQPKRTPRPPNAFFLYRSDFLKRRTIPPEVEKRQQNLSRIAGQCWNMLPETEKATWYGKAAVVRAEYRIRYPSNVTGPFHKDVNRLSVKAKRRGSASNPRRSSCRSRSRRTQSSYSESMFATLHDSKISSLGSQVSLISPIPVSESPLSTTASLSPLLLSHLLPSFASHTNSGSQNSLPATSDNSIRNEAGDPLASLGFEVPRGVSHIIRDPKNASSEIGSSQEPYPTPQHYEDNLATCVPYACLTQLPTLYSDPVSQLPLTLSETNFTFSPAGHYLANCHSLANDFGVTDNVAHFNQFLVPLYP